MTEIVLASGSPIRRELLDRAGVSSRAVTADINEDAIKLSCRDHALDVQATALQLARSKALDVARDEPRALVIGADQILDLDGNWLGKPRDRADATDQLGQLSGRSHHLVTAVSVVTDASESWRHCNVATLTMIPLDAQGIERYLDTVGEAVFNAVGAYHVEGQGICLFDRIDGDFFSILGLPLLPLLQELRARGDVVP